VCLTQKHGNKEQIACSITQPVRAIWQAELWSVTPGGIHSNAGGGGERSGGRQNANRL